MDLCIVEQKRRRPRRPARGVGRRARPPGDDAARGRDRRRPVARPDAATARRRRSGPSSRSSARPTRGSRRRWRSCARPTTRGVPVLGLCFGGQALAAALGGGCAGRAAPEIGWLELEPLDGGAFPPGPVVRVARRHLHAAARRRRARAQRVCPHAFRVGRSVGLQFHPEVTPAIVEGWIRDGRARSPRERIDGDAIRAQTRAGAAAHREPAFALFDADRRRTGRTIDGQTSKPEWPD